MTSTTFRSATTLGLIALALSVGACSSSSTKKDAGATGGTGGGTGGAGTGGAPGTGGVDAAVATDAPAADSSSDGVSCPSLGALTPPTVPAAIQAPAGTTLALRLHAEGSQIYTCTAKAPAADAGVDGGGTTYSWVFKAPDAKLYDASCVQVGTHFMGPTWKSTVDESAVVGMSFANAASPAGAIPWLLLKAVSHMGQGVVSSITWVQRVDTMGGVAPTTGCDAAAAGTDRAVPYSP